ncbi:hypothetical protein ACFOD4_07690 [Pseudoroseomonas globiformis]|uniref:Uncharacterized protein n=1 Tax=Teichococcus globiformis TaxID=2307229 RepID=A0ABV7FX44_9PROT
MTGRLARFLVQAVLLLALLMPDIGRSVPLPPEPAMLQAARWESSVSCTRLLPGAERGEGCRQGRNLSALGWTLIDYGVATLKYVVGLLLILFGAMLVGLGWAFSLIEALIC